MLTAVVSICRMTLYLRQEHRSSRQRTLQSDHF